MPSKIKVRPEVDPVQHDQVMTTLQKTYGTLDKYKLHIVVGFVGLIVVLLGISGLLSLREGGQTDSSKAFFEAFRLSAAPVGPDAKPAGTLKPFKTEADRDAALSTALKSFLDEHGGDAVADAARFAYASVLLDMGETQQAHDLLAGLVESEPVGQFKGLLLKNLAHTSLLLGKFEDAEKFYSQLNEISLDPTVKARALMYLGDLYNPATDSIKSSKDAAKARDFYEQAMKLFPETPEENALPAELALPKAYDAAGEVRKDVLLRMALLNS